MQLRRVWNLLLRPREKPHRRADRSADGVDYAVIVRTKVPFMVAMVEALAGDALLSLEGDLADVWPDIVAMPGTQFDEIGILKRNTIWPRQDFAILPVEPETVDYLVRKILHRIGLKRRVIHILVAKKGQLQLESYDNFDGEIRVGSAVPRDVMQRLLDDRVIRSFRVFGR